MNKWRSTAGRAAVSDATGVQISAVVTTRVRGTCEGCGGRYASSCSSISASSASSPSGGAPGRRGGEVEIP